MDIKRGRPETTPVSLFFSLGISIDKMAVEFPLAGAAETTPVVEYNLRHTYACTASLCLEQPTGFAPLAESQTHLTFVRCGLEISLNGTNQQQEDRGIAAATQISGLDLLFE